MISKVYSNKRVKTLKQPYHLHFHNLGSWCLAFLGSRSQLHLNLLKGQGEVAEEFSKEHLEDIPE